MERPYAPKGARGCTIAILMMICIACIILMLIWREVYPANAQAPTSIPELIRGGCIWEVEWYTANPTYNSFAEITIRKLGSTVNEGITAPRVSYDPITDRSVYRTVFTPPGAGFYQVVKVGVAWYDDQNAYHWTEGSSNQKTFLIRCRTFIPGLFRRFWF